MSKPVLSLDVSKDSSYATTFLSRGERMDKPFYVPHSPQGLETLIQRLSILEERTGIRPEIILEATGNYSKPISYYLQTAGYQVIVLNPLQTHTQKKSSIRKVKTDPIDATRIAELYYLQDFKPNYVPEPKVVELRNLCRNYEGINNLHTETQLRFLSTLDLLFPGLKSVFPDLKSDTSLRLLNEFPTPSDILAADKEDILKHLKKARQRKNWAEEKYQKLIAAAKASLPYNLAKQSNARVLKEYISLLMTQKMSLAHLRALVDAAAKDIPAYSLLLSIPGVGSLTAAIIISEIEDIHRFPTPKQLVAYAGIDTSVFESGRFKATKNKISKRGSNYLRKALYQATISAICKRKNGYANPVLYEYYSQKVAEGKAKKVALIAASHKLLRIIYGVWRNNEPFKLV